MFTHILDCIKTIVYGPNPPALLKHYMELYNAILIKLPKILLLPKSVNKNAFLKAKQILSSITLPHEKQ